MLIAGVRFIWVKEATSVKEQCWKEKTSASVFNWVYVGAGVKMFHKEYTHVSFIFYVCIRYNICYVLPVCVHSNTHKHTYLPTYCSVFKVVEAVVCQNEPPSLPCLHSAACGEKHIISKLKLKRRQGLCMYRLTYRRPPLHVPHLVLIINSMQD